MKNIHSSLTYLFGNSLLFALLVWTLAACGLGTIIVFSFWSSSFWYVGGDWRTTPPSSETFISDRRTSQEFINSASFLVKDIQARILSLQSILRNRTRILCWVMTAPKSDEKRTAIVETWGKRCDLILFMVGGREMREFDATAVSNRFPHLRPTSSTRRRRKIGPNAYIVYLDIDKDRYDNLWLKTRLAFLYIHEHYPARANYYDWILKVDDDAFVIMENLRLFLSDRNQNDPFYYGCQYNGSGAAPDGFASGGPGYVISRANAEKMIDAMMKGHPSLANKSSSSSSERRDNVSHRTLTSSTSTSRRPIAACGSRGGPEDVRIAQCLSEVGIRPADTRDVTGRFRFLPFPPEAAIHSPLSKLPGQYQWFWGLSSHNLPQGFDCCSDGAISFHYITPKMMRVMEYLIYYVHPFSSREMWGWRPENRTQRTTDDDDITTLYDLL